MLAERGDRMFASLPAVYRSSDTTRDLRELLIVLEMLFFSGCNSDGIILQGMEQYIRLIPALFLPISETSDEGQTPKLFLPWLASWLSFTPYRFFSPEA